MPTPEHQVRCLPAMADAAGNERLLFELNGSPKAATLKIGALSESLVADLPDAATDFLEIVAFVYAIDASVSRGRPVGRHMAEDWQRHFDVELPVRRPNFWSRPEVCDALERMEFRRFRGHPLTEVERCSHATNKEPVPGGFPGPDRRVA